MVGRIWPGLLVLILSLEGGASVPILPTHLPGSSSQRELAWKSPTRASEFSDVPHVSTRARCEDTRPPEALTTPDPLLITPGKGQRVKVSFIIGTDGHVHSPLILESGGPAGDRNVLRTVRSWRYRPATCNGVPTESEGKIEFSRR